MCNTAHLMDTGAKLQPIQSIHLSKNMHDALLTVSIKAMKPLFPWHLHKMLSHFHSEFLLPRLADPYCSSKIT